MKDIGSPCDHSRWIAAFPPRKGLLLLLVGALERAAKMRPCASARARPSSHSTRINSCSNWVEPPSTTSNIPYASRRV